VGKYLVSWQHIPSQCSASSASSLPKIVIYKDMVIAKHLTITIVIINTILVLLFYENKLMSRGFIVSRWYFLLTRKWLSFFYKVQKISYIKYCFLVDQCVFVKERGYWSWISPKTFDELLSFLILELFYQLKSTFGIRVWPIY